MYHVWVITEATSDGFEPILISTLLDNGYLVAASSADGETSLKHKQLSTSLISIQLSHPDGLHTAHIMYNEIIKILQDINANYHSVIISPSHHDARWGLGTYRVVVDYTGMLN